MHMQDKELCELISTVADIIMDRVYRKDFTPPKPDEIMTELRRIRPRDSTKRKPTKMPA